MGTRWSAPGAFLVGLLLSTPAWAIITVEVVKGDVSVKQGEGFRKIAGATEVYPGDKVMTSPDGKAKIIYPNGCVVPVGPGGIASVGECKEPMTAGLEPVDEKALVPPPVAFPWVPVVVGGLIIAGGICAVTCGDNDNGGGRKPPEEKSP